MSRPPPAFWLTAVAALFVAVAFWLVAVALAQLCVCAGRLCECVDEPVPPLAAAAEFAYVVPRTWRLVLLDASSPYVVIEWLCEPPVIPLDTAPPLTVWAWAFWVCVWAFCVWLCASCTWVCTGIWATVKVTSSAPPVEPAAWLGPQASRKVSSICTHSVSSKSAAGSVASTLMYTYPMGNGHTLTSRISYAAFLMPLSRPLPCVDAQPRGHDVDRRLRARKAVGMGRPPPVCPE